MHLGDAPKKADERNDSRASRYIEEWKSRLIDLSRRNKLLYFTHTKRGNLSITHPDPETVFNRLVHKKCNMEFWLPPEEAITELQAIPKTQKSFPAHTDRPTANQMACDETNRKEIEKKLTKLSRRALSDYRERGVRILYAAFGKLNWREKNTNEEIHSPLILVPIELTRRSVWEPFTISVPPVEETAIANPALQAKLKTDAKIDLPPFPENGDRGSLINYLNSISQLVQKLGWTVETNLEIGLFSFHKLVIYRDLEANAVSVARHPIVRAIAGIKDTPLIMDSLPEEKDVDQIEDPEKIFQVLDADSSQRVSINYALRGQSFVMQGPPGTGKSQTIANIIAECIARGKSVLFVSEKMAALEVVYKRLKEVGLAPFCLELHSSKANKQEVVAELVRCLKEQLVPQRLPLASDFEKLNELQEALNGYVQSLHKKHPTLQMSPYEVLSTLSSLEPTPSIPVELPKIAGLSPQKMRELENLMNHLCSVWQVVEEEDFPWRGYRENNYTLDTRSEISRFLEDIISKIDLLRLESADFSKLLGLDPPNRLTQVDWLIEIGKLLTESPKPEALWITHPNIYTLIQEAKALQDMFHWRQTTRTRLLTSYEESFFSLDPNKSIEIEQALNALTQSINPSSIEEGELLQKRERLSKFLSLTDGLLDKWTKFCKELIRQFNLPTNSLTVERVRNLSRITQLCSAKNKPETAWFNPANFNKLQETLPKARKNFEDHKTLRDRIEKTYTNEIYTLNLDQLIARYGGPNKGSLRWFRPSYHRDQKNIALTTLEGKVPKTVLKDLVEARRILQLQAEIAANADMLKQLLGHFYEGSRTDFETVERAIAAASEIFTLSGQDPIPENLSKLASHGTDPPQQIQKLGAELQESLNEWSRLLEELSSIIPTSSLPNSKLPIYKTQLTELQEWANNTEAKLSNLFVTEQEAVVTYKTEPQNYKQLTDDLKTSETLQQKESAFLKQTTLLKAKFGPRFQEFNTDWKDILSVLEWTKKVQLLFDTTKIPETYTKLISTGPENAPPTENLVRYRDNALQALSTFESRFENELTYEGQKLHQATIESIHKKFITLRDRVDDMRLWVDFKDTEDKFALVGLAPFFTRLTKQAPPASQLVGIIRKGTYQEWINNLYSEDNCLGQFRRAHQEKTIAEFRKIDQDLIRLSPNRVIDKANQRKPQDILIQAEDTEMGILLKESAKKRRLMPIRALLQRIPNLLHRLKPCLLMSPISVSQFLPPDPAKFDIILYDEASQIVPEDAIGSIYRGKTIVVAGDNKQLPPTSFFQKSLIEDIDWDELTEGEIEVFDSILDECIGIRLPVKTLRWHYRSRHEQLIAFSNNRFYDGNLITFPAAKAEHESLGIKLHQIKNAVYDRGGLRNNPIEAETVANLVFEHFQKHPEKTLGVVTFSIAQMETIEEALERRLRDHPEHEHFFKEDRLEGFFVKNLENVQGDERDVIIFSIGYGRDPRGQMTLNFGPLNKAGGERRLNVAVTRAREKIVLVTSIKSIDMNVGPASPAGVLALRGYLEYAEKTCETTEPTQSTPKFDSLLEETVASEIQHFDFAVSSKVGSSTYPIDIAVVDPANPGCYLLGIECDGSTYRASNSARDRDRLRNQVLRQLGWKIYRIWSPDWVARRDSEVRQLREAIEEACKSQTEGTPLEHSELEAKQNGIAQKNEIIQTKFGGAELIGVPYKVHTLKAYFDPYVRVSLSRYPYTSVQKNEFHFPENRVLQSRLLEELVREEGPIHLEYAVQRLAATWGVNRTTQKATYAVKEALNLLIKDHRVAVKGEFLWPNDLQEVQVRVPDPGIPETIRPPSHIPPEEIENAMKLIVQYALSISTESLMTETAKLFGFPHSGQKAKTKFQEVFERMARQKKLILFNNTVTMPQCPETLT